MSGEVDCSKPLDRAGQAQKLIGVIDALLTQWASLNLHSFDSAFFLRQWPKLHALYEQAKVLALGLGFVAPVTVRVHEIPATRTHVPVPGNPTYYLVTSPRVEQEVTSVPATWEQEVKGLRVAAEMALKAQDDEKATAAATGAVFPWGRAILAFALLIVLESLAVIGVWLWGQGDNLFQKTRNCWYLLGSQFPLVLLVSRLILGRPGWLQVKKMWHSWWGEA